MSGSELATLSRAHGLFVGATREATLDAGSAQYDPFLGRATGVNTGGGHQFYQSAVGRSRDALRSAATTDAAAAATVAQAHRDHAHARSLTKSVLDEARADTAITDNPMAQREAIRRRVARLRAQRAHVLSARQQARRHRGATRLALPSHATALTEAPRADYGCRRRTAAPVSRCGRRCHDWAGHMSGARPGPTVSTVQG